MKLSMAAILEHLNESFPVLAYHIQNDDNFISQVMFPNRQTPPVDHTIYLVEPCGDDMPVILSDLNAVILFGSCPSAYRDKGCNYIVLDSLASPSDTLNCIQQLFCRVSSWENNALSLLLSGKGLQSLFDSALSILDNPIYLHDKNYRIVVYSENRSNPAMSKSYEFLRAGRMPPQAILGLTQNPDFTKTFESSKAAYWKKTSVYPDEYNYLYVNIWNEGVFAGRIFVDERVRPFCRLDYVILERLCELVSQTFKCRCLSSEYHMNHMEDLLKHILDGRLIDRPELEIELRETNWDINDHYFVFSIQMKEDDIRYNIADSICCTIEKSLPKSCVFQYGDRITGVVNTGGSDMRRHSFIRIMTPVLKDFKVRAGVSLVFDNLLELNEHYRQSQDALRTGIQCGSTSLLMFFEDYTMEYVMNTLTGGCSPESLYPEGLKRLIAHDRANGADYVRTLRAYLENNCSPAQAAKMLFIHRSTFLYRLEKINEITGICLDDCTERLHYQIAFQLMDRRQTECSRASLPLSSPMVHVS